ncbi:MAG TPA: phenylacetic acid degradation protein [Acidimicrobiales bacterium]|nr:phenylacetic acid degradation protein [Acidimicrobiales bacterium]
MKGTVGVRGRALTEGGRIWDEGDGDLPTEFHDLLVRMLTYHIENDSNPNYHDLLGMLGDRCRRFAPDERTGASLDRLMNQEVEHGQINARILAGLGVPRVDRPIEQYAFRLPIDTFCDLAMFHGLIDRVGCYIGETWEGVPYRPLLEVAPRLHREEIFHATLGLRNLKLICSTPDGRDEANELIAKWWPAALDMFGRSDSEFGDEYVRWGLRQQNNADLRRSYIEDTRPLLEELGIDVPANRLNRRFL